MFSSRLLTTLKGLGYLTVIIAALLGIYRLITMSSPLPASTRPPAQVTIPGGPIMSVQPVVVPVPVPVQADAGAAPDARPPTATTPVKPRPRAVSGKVGRNFWCRHIKMSRTTLGFCKLTEKACKTTTGKAGFAMQPCFEQDQTYCFAYTKVNGKIDIHCSPNEIDCEAWRGVDGFNEPTVCTRLDVAGWMRVAAKFMRTNGEM